MESSPNLPALYAALAKARAEVQPAAHDAKNDYHRYAYTSAEAVILACSPVLARNGLALVPVGFAYATERRVVEVPVKNREDQTRAIEECSIKVTTDWLLTHAEGGSLSLHREMATKTENGRPEDKALLVANTATLAYLLRDLCGLARPDADDDLNKRDDTGYQQRQPTVKPVNGKSNGKASAPAAPAPKSEHVDQGTGEVVTLADPGAVRKWIQATLQAKQWPEDDAVLAVTGYLETKFQAKRVADLTTTQRGELVAAIQSGTFDQYRPEPASAAN